MNINKSNLRNAITSYIAIAILVTLPLSWPRLSHADREYHRDSPPHWVTPGPRNYHPRRDYNHHPNQHFWGPWDNNRHPTPWWRRHPSDRRPSDCWMSDHGTYKCRERW